jgi:glycosyltransferase involved in cell wall biosynthesis
MRIAIIGTRGIPARYGGFETFAEELSLRLAKRGHEVTVYGRRYFGEPCQAPTEYKGVKVRILPTARHKYLETPLHACLSLLDALKLKFNLVLLCNAANSPMAWIWRLGGKPLVVNVDGIERKRAKWNLLGRIWYRLGERCSVWFSSKAVADAEVIARYYRERYGIQPAVIGYGADGHNIPGGEVLRKFSLTPREYLLYVSRFEPENNALGVVQAYRRVGGSLPLVMVGDAPYAKDYIAQVKQAADTRVIFTGFQFGDAYRELRSNCLLYIQATEVGGTHPALVEAMAHGNCIVANQVPEHEEVLGECGLYYRRNDFEDLAWRVQELLAEPDRIRELGGRARKRALELYSWDKVVGQYEALFQELLSDSKGPGSSGE